MVEGRLGSAGPKGWRGLPSPALSESGIYKGLFGENEQEALSLQKGSRYITMNLVFFPKQRLFTALNMFS